MSPFLYTKKPVHEVQNNLIETFAMNKDKKVDGTVIIGKKALDTDRNLDRIQAVTKMYIYKTHFWCIIFHLFGRSFYVRFIKCE